MKALDKVRRAAFTGYRRRHPSHLVWIVRPILVKIAFQQRRWYFHERNVLHRGADAVQPSSEILFPWTRKRGATQLFRVQPVRRFLRVVLPFRQRIWKRFAFERISKAALVPGTGRHHRTSIAPPPEDGRLLMLRV